MSNLAKAIKALRPTAEFSYSDNDYSTIKWDKLQGDAPTQSEIDAAIKQVEADEIATQKAQQSAKSALLKKLGLTEDEAALLLA
jgi:outer membrane protein TolC